MKKKYIIKAKPKKDQIKSSYSFLLRCGSGSNWFVYKRYKTEKARDDGYKTIISNKNNNKYYDFEIENL